MSARLRRESATRASAVIGALSELWFRTFAVQGRHRRPLSIGIHSTLLVAAAPAIMAGTITVTDINRALRRYTGADDICATCASAPGGSIWTARLSASSPARKRRTPANS
jgi:hypothetical protein